MSPIHDVHESGSRPAKLRPRPLAWAAGVALLYLLGGSVSVAQAKDAVRASITDADGGIVTENGAFHVPGTYAVGTIKIDYLIVGYQFPADTPLRSFEMCLATVEGKAKPTTAYPATVSLRQAGSANASLGINPSQVVFDGAGEEECVEVSITVPADIANDLDFQEDGTEIVANLQISTPPRTHLDTVTTVKAHLTLVHPSATACVRALHLVADNGLNGNLSTAGIALQAHVSNGLQGTPQGQHVVALVNTCTDSKGVDLDTEINESFELQSASAVQTTVTNQQFVDIQALLGANLNTATFSNQGTNLCLAGIEIPGEQTFVVKQHLSMKSTAKFPGTGCNTSTTCAANQTLSVWHYDGFTYAAHVTGGSSCADLSLSSDVDPAEGEVTTPITQVSYTGPSAPATEYPPAP